MLRRSRISVRPNVSVAGRTGAPTTPQDAPPQNQGAIDIPAEGNEEHTATAETKEPTVEPSGAAAGDTNDENGEGVSSSAAVQRRKRFSVKPKVAPRTWTSVRTPKSSVKAASEAQAPGPDPDKPTTSSQKETTVAQELQSQSRQKPSGESRQPKMQPTLSSPPPPSPTAVSPAEDTAEEAPLPSDKGKKSESIQARDVPPKPPDKIPPSLPEKEALEISERAETLVSRSSKSGSHLPAPRMSLSRLLNDPVDLQRLAKARKLRELLRQEMEKEKKLKKDKARQKEYILDPAKMTMRDLIYYLPNSNPMTSYLEDTGRENETEIPPSVAREKSPERAQEPEILPETVSQTVEDEEEVEAEEEQDQPLMAPRVKVAEDGSLIIDEESLTVEVQRLEGANPVEERDTVFERGTTTTYSSFRKGTYTKPWSNEETDMFFVAVSMVGTDFSMICQLFPHRARSEIKNKFKKEERENAWRIDKAFRERRKLDIEYFSKLLEKILEVQNSKSKKPKPPSEKKTPTKKRNRKAKEKKSKRKLSDVEEEDEEDATPYLEEVEGEKENEDISNEGGTPASTPKRKYKRKKGEESSPNKPNDNKMARPEKNKEQGEAHTPEDAEAALPEDQTNLNMSEETEPTKATKGTTIKPAQLSRGRAPKPLLPLGRKWGRKCQAPNTKPNVGATDAAQESLGDEASKREVDKDASPSRPAKERKLDNDATSSEGEGDSAVKPLKPTRYGRMPKPIQHLNYPAKEGTHSKASETTCGSASPEGPSTTTAKPKPKCQAKKARSSKAQVAQEPKKSKLVTLRASQSESSDDEDGNHTEADEVEEEQQHPSCSSKDSSAPVFVPVSLRSPQPVVSEVEETMEELDILVNVPDVLGISQDALCPDASCKQAQDETGTAGPSEHQLDLLVDVIDFLSLDQGKVTEEESYNEAAQTLLTIGNLAHLSQPAQSHTSAQDHTAGTATASGNETCSQDPEEDIVLKPVAHVQNSTAVTETSDCTVTEATEIVEQEKPECSTTHEDLLSQTDDVQNNATMTVTSDCRVTEPTQTVEEEERESSITDQDPSSQTGDIPIIKASDSTYSKQEIAANVERASQAESSSDVSEQNSQQTRRRRLSKVKPKPNLGRASGIARSKKEAMTSPVSTVKESHTVAPELSGVTQSLSVTDESTSEIADSGSASLICDSASAQVTTEPSVTQEKAVDEEFAPQVESHCTISDQQSSQNKTKMKPNLGRDTRNAKPQSVSADEKLKSLVETSESSCINPGTSYAAVKEAQVSPRSNTVDPVPVQESSDHPAATIAATEELSKIQEEESGDGSTCQTRITTRGHFCKVKPKPNLRKTPRTVQSESQPKEDTVTHFKPTENPSSPTCSPKSTLNTVAQLEPQPACSTTPHAEPPLSTGPASDLTPSVGINHPQKPTEEIFTGEETKAEVGPAYQVDSSSECLERDVRRRRFPKVKPKPNVGPSTRTAQSKQAHIGRSSNASSKKTPMTDSTSHGEVKTTEKASEHLTSPHCLLNREHLSSISSGEAGPERSLENTTPQRRSPDDVVMETSGLTQDQVVLTGSVPETLSSNESTMQVEPPGKCASSQDKVEAGTSPRMGYNLRTSTQTAGSNYQTREDAPAMSESQSSENGSTPSKDASQQTTNVQSKPVPTENPQQPCSESSDVVRVDDSLFKDQDVFQRNLYENTETTQTVQDHFQAAQCAGGSESELLDSNKSLGNALQTCRATPPKSNLGCSDPCRHPHPAQNTTHLQPDSGTCVQVLQDAAPHKLDSNIQEPAEGADDLSNAVSLDCVTHIPIKSTQDPASSSTSGTQSYPDLTTHLEVLSEQAPSDPEEPFFILSLTEIPFLPSGEEVGSVSEPLPCVSVSEAPAQPQSSVLAASGGSLAGSCSAPVPVSMEEGGRRDFTSVMDVESALTTCTDSVTKKPVDQHGTTDPQVQPSTLPETDEISEIDVPSKKRRLDTGRRAKLQVKPNTSRKKQACRTLTAEEAEVSKQTNAIPEADLRCPPAQAETLDAAARAGGEALAEPQKGTSSCLETGKDTPSRGCDMEDRSPEVQTQASHQTTQPPVTSTRNRKPKGFLSILSESTAPSGQPQRVKTGSRAPKVKTSCTGRKRAAPEAVTSTALLEDCHSTAATPTTSAQAEVDIQQSTEGRPSCPDPGPSTSRCVAQAPAAQQCDSVENTFAEEEPTCVTQYFLSNIFTEVDEG